jgi:hypothetical protein
MPRAGATAAELLRLEGRVVGEGDTASLLERFVGVLATDRGLFPSSQGSFFTAVHEVGFLTTSPGITFSRALGIAKAESAPATMAANLRSWTK